MASMLVRASRGAARAAAPAASRCAAAAASASSCVATGGGAGAASFRLLPRRSPAVASSPPFWRAGLSSQPNLDDDNMTCDSDEFYDPDCSYHVFSDDGGDDSESESYSDDSDGEERVLHTPTPTGKVEFVADDKDLESDEALWALYERWCKAWGEERDHDEMLRRFGRFKECALYVDRFNKEAIKVGQSARLCINMFADGKLRELSSNKMPFSGCEFMLSDSDEVEKKIPVKRLSANELKCKNPVA